jgi:ribosomal protein S18 acetylase RimI-like enzyme
MDSLLLRRATVEDAQGIAHVSVETWKTAYSGLLPDDYLQKMSVDQRTQTWAKLLEFSPEGNQTIVAEIDGRIIGFIGIGPSSEVGAMEFGEVYAIYVRPNYQSRGAGSQLLKEGIRILKSQGFNRATLWVLEQNISARSWYESHGWHPNGKSKIEKRANFEMQEAQYVIDFE